MTTIPFLRPRLTGARFDGHAIPLEFLKDLAVLEEMIAEVAKSAFQTDHPNRKRSPRGFSEGIAMKLTGIEDGSAIPVISLVVASMTLFPPNNQTYFERARDSVIGAISAAEHNLTITDYLPEKTLGYFDRIGRSLRDGEAMEFERPDGLGKTRLTKETRRRLVLASSNLKELTDETTVRGSVPEADQDDMTFELQLLDGRKVKAPIAAQHLDTVLGAFNGYRSGVRILLQGIGLFSRSERLLGFDSIEHASLLDPQDVLSRLDELRQMQDGWLEGRGVALSARGIDWLGEAFSRNYPDELPLPFVYPTEEGGIRLEWAIEPFDVSLDIDLVGHTAGWHALNAQVDAEEEKVIDLSREEAWRWVANQIEAMAGGRREP